MLFANALEVDARAEIPAENLGALAGAGLFGIAGPVEAGGLDLDARAQRRVREVLAGGCLTTAFVWAQHQSVVRRVRLAGAALQEQWMADLCAGRVRGGIVLAGLLPGPEPLLRIAPSLGGFVIRGTAPAVSGWGIVDILLVVARRAGPDRSSTRSSTSPRRPARAAAELAALNGTRTVALGFEDVAVPASAVVAERPLPPWEAAGDGVRANGAFAIGVADRCVRMSGEPALHAEVDRCRPRSTPVPTATSSRGRAPAARCWQRPPRPVSSSSRAARRSTRASTPSAWPARPSSCSPSASAQRSGRRCWRGSATAAAAAAEWPSRLRTRQVDTGHVLTADEPRTAPEKLAGCRPGVRSGRRLELAGRARWRARVLVRPCRQGGVGRGQNCIDEGRAAVVGGDRGAASGWSRGVKQRPTHRRREPLRRSFTP